jgi:heparan-alpha-glucosaminide N-acetyltransferase
LDRLILGEKHIYQHPTAREVYKSGPFDPEGVVGKMQIGVPVTTSAFYLFRTAT